MVKKEVIRTENRISVLLKESRKNHGLSVQEVVERLAKLGVNISGKTLYGWEGGRRQPDAEEFLTLCQVYEISAFPETIKKAPSLSDGAMKIAKIFDGLDAWGQKALLSAAEIEAARCDESSARARAIPANVIPLRCSVQSASAGTGMYLGPEEFETVFVEENDLTRRASFGVPVRGDSMEPVYHDGDILIVEAAEEVGVGETGVFTVSGEGFVKQRGEGALISLNPKYAPIALTEDTWCNGRVIGVLAPAWIVKK